MTILQSQGYEIKYGKYISFRTVGQKRFTRAKTIGFDYTEEKIKERITDFRKNKKRQLYSLKNSSNKIIDISSNQLASKSEGFARWLKLQNLKTISKSWSSFTESTDIDSFHVHVKNVHDDLSRLQSEIKIIEIKFQSTQLLINNIETYTRYNDIYSTYQTTHDKDGFFRIHEREIILYEAARHSITQPISEGLIASVPSLNIQISELQSKLGEYNSKLKATKQRVKDINQLRSDLDTYLRSGVSVK